MIELINIYNDDQSAIIIDNTSTNLVQVEQYPTLGDSPFNTQNTLNSMAENNLQFIELNVLDENENLVVTLNSARPLLKQNSTGNYYFGDFHYHSPTETYMTGKKHVPTPHESLEVVRNNQLIPYPLEDKFIGNSNFSNRKFAIKMTEIFEILDNIPNFTLVPNSKFFITYGIFQDVFLKVREQLSGPGVTQ